MTTMSVFGFERRAMQLAGPFTQMHKAIDPQARTLDLEAGWNMPSTHAIVVYLRPTNEISQSLSSVVNAPAVLDFIAGQFAAAPDSQYVHRPKRVGPVRTSYKQWGDVISAPNTSLMNPKAHQPWELITTISVDFHCDTYFLLSALKGTITLYVYYFLDSSRVPRVRLEGFSDPVWDEEPRRPDDGAAGKVSAALAGELGHDEAPIQLLLSRALDSFVDGPRPFSDLYVLPGTGVTVSAPTRDNADNNVALCLVPA